MPSLSPEQQLERALARTSRLRGQVAERNRRRENRLKVLLGVALLNELQHDKGRVGEVRMLVRNRLVTKSKSIRVKQRATRDREFVLAELDRLYSRPSKSSLAS